MKRRIELARVGAHGQNGIPVTAADLAEIAVTFREQKTAPIVIGHSLADWMPQFGEVTSVEFNATTGVLEGDIELNELLAESWTKKLYTQWSISAPRRASDGKRFLHHLAFLGATPAAVKGLKVLEAINLSDVDRRDYIAIVAGDARREESMNMEELQREFSAERVKREAAEAELASLRQKAAGTEKVTQELSDANAKLAETTRQIKAAKIAALKTSAAGRVPSELINDLVAIADQLDPASTIELSDTAGKTEKVGSIELLERIVKALPRQVTEGELNLGDAPLPGGEPGGKSVFAGLAAHV